MRLFVLGAKRSTHFDGVAVSTLDALVRRNHLRGEAGLTAGS